MYFAIPPGEVTQRKLSPTHREHLRQFMNFIHLNRGKTRRHVYVVDLTQRARVLGLSLTHRANNMPCMLRKSSHYNIRLQREIDPLERFLVTGIPSLDSVAAESGLPNRMSQSIPKLSAADACSLNGNGMAFSTIGPVVSFSLSCCIPRPCVEIESHDEI